MNEQEFKRRTKQLALQTIALVDALPKTRSADALARQFVRSGTSVGSNYRSACRGKSIDDVIAKLGIVEEEADESIYWLELMAESNMTAEARVKPLMNEFGEILAMTVASMKTLRARKQSAVKYTNPKSKIQNPK